jgi:hypothetical protein
MLCVRAENFSDTLRYLEIGDKLEKAVLAL